MTIVVILIFNIFIRVLRLYINTVPYNITSVQKQMGSGGTGFTLVVLIVYYGRSYIYSAFLTQSLARRRIIGGGVGAGWYRVPVAKPGSSSSPSTCRSPPMESKVFCGRPGAESATLRFLLAFSLVLHLMAFFWPVLAGQGLLLLLLLSKISTTNICFNF